MQRISGVVAWYQHKIGTYDKQLWEKSVEETVLMNIEKVPRKITKVKTDLIDVDLVRGSTFPKAKPQHGNLAVTITGVLRVIFYPYYIAWWRQQTSTWFSGLLLMMYSLQIACLVVYYQDTGQNVNAEKLSLAHLYIPVITMCALGLVHAHIVATHSAHRHRPRTPDRGSQRKRQKKHKTSTQDKTNPNVAGSDNHRNEADRYGNRLDHPDNDINHLGDVEDSVTFSDTAHRKKKVMRRRSPSYGSDDRFQTGSRTNLRHLPNVEKYETARKQTSQSRENKQICDECIHSGNRSKTGTLNRDINVLQDTLHGNEPDCYSSDLQFCAQNRNQNETGLSQSENETGESQFGVQEQQSNNKCGTNSKKSGKCHSSFSSAYHRQQSGKSGDVRFESREDFIKGAPLVYKTKDGEPVSCKTDERVDCPLPSVDGQILLPENDSFNLANGLSITVGSQPRTKAQESNAESRTFEYLPPPHKLENVKAGEDISPYPGQGYSLYGEPQKDIRVPVFESRRQVEIQNGENSSKFEDVLVAACQSEAAAMLDSCDSSLEPVGTLIKIRPGQGLESAQCEHSKEKLGENESEIDQNSGTRQPTAGHAFDDDFGHESDKGEEAGPRKPRFLAVRMALKDSQSSGESDAGTTPTTNTPKGQTSEMEWDDTMNSGDMTTDTSSACSSESEASDNADVSSDSFNLHQANSVMNSLASSTDKVSCIIWMREEVNKVDLSVLDLGYAIIRKADRLPESTEYLWMGAITSLLLTCLPIVFRIHVYGTHVEQIHLQNLNLENITHLLQATPILLGSNWRESLILFNGVIQRFVIAAIFFFLLSVAERTYKQRLLYAKHFCYLTSSRRAKKYDMPHFRLNKVRNIKTWLSLRSYLKKRGPQRSVDSIVSATFLLTVMFLSLMCVELLHDSEGFLDHLGNWELVAWCLALGIYLLRFMTLGHKINKKYRNFSVLITEQINLYLHMEQKPHKKDELTLANNVLKLAEALLKELENPFKISGLSINPLLYNITKVVILSAFSAVLTELLGFKLKLYKIKLK